MALKLEEVRVKKASDVSEAEKTFLAEHKDELTDDERKAFGLEASQPPKKPEGDKKPKEGDAKTATISADELKQLKADAEAGRDAQQRLAKKEAEDLVQGHIDAGRIKSDKKNSTVELLLGATGEQREKLEAHLAALPVNPLLAGERGDQGANTQDGSASNELHEQVVKAQREAFEKDGKNLNYVTVRKQILASDKSLAERVKAEQEEK